MISIIELLTELGYIVINISMGGTKSQLRPVDASSILIDTGGRAPRATQLDVSNLIDKAGDSWELRQRRTEHFDCLEGKFMVTFIELPRLLRMHRVSSVNCAVLNWLTENIITDNLVSGVSQKQIAMDCGTTQPNVSQAITKLEDLDVLQRGGQGAIFLNPRYVFVGAPPRQHVACKAWDQRKAERRRARLASVVEVKQA
jgi:hypothetical protein